MYALLIAEDPDDVAIFSMVLQRAGLAVSTTKALDSAIQNWMERPADIVLVSLPRHKSKSSESGPRPWLL